MTASTDRTTISAPSLLQAETSLVDARIGFQNGFVFELFDAAPGAGIIATHVLVLNPSGYTLGEPFQAALTPTEDNSIVAEEVGTIMRDITLEGTFGLAKKRVTSFAGAQGGGAELSGSEHFMKLRNLFREYSRLKKDHTRSENIRMHFHALRDDDHFIVVPKMFETPRDAKGNRVHYEYRIQLTVVGTVDGSTLRPRADESDFSDALRDINESFHDMRGYFSDITASISKARRYVGTINTVMRQGAVLINSVGNVVRGASSFIEGSILGFVSTIEEYERTSLRLADSIVAFQAGTDDLFGVERAIRRLEAAGDRIAAYPEKFAPPTGSGVAAAYDGERRLTQRDVRERTAGANVGSRTRVALGSESRAGLDLSVYTGRLTVMVTRTDTVEGLAARYGVEPEAIIIINDLRPPYIAEGGGPGILAPGDEMLIPVIGGAALTASPSNAFYRTPDDLLYGVDLMIDPTTFEREGLFEIQIDAAHGATDASLIRGVQNVVQGTRITIETERGSTTFLPQVGILRNVGVRGTLQHMLLAALRLREAVLSDPRIERIASSRIVLEADVLTQEITPVVRGRTAAPTIAIPFGRASGGGA